MKSTFMIDNNLSKEIDMCFDNDDWSRAVDILQNALDKNPDDHWILTRLSSVYYEMKEYDKALQLSNRAMKIAPACPLALSNHASVLDMSKREKEAINIWNILIKKRIDEVAYGECGEGRTWAKSLINDAVYRIGLSYLDIGEKKKALEYFGIHLKNRERGVFSNFSRKEVLFQISMIRKDMELKTQLTVRTHEKTDGQLFMETEKHCNEDV